MEIRCDKCTHVGPAAEVRPGADGVVLVCENCGHENILDVGASEGARSEAADSPEEAGEPASAPVEDFEDNDQVRMWLRDDALKALIPEPGSHPRCRKCAQLLEPSAENCARCGLNRREAERYAAGEAPWEQPPAGKEAEYDQARLLWESFDRQPSEEKLDKFVSFVGAEDLLDFGIRRLRFYLIDHPDDRKAVAHLRDLAESLQSRIVVAQVQAKASADEFKEDVSRFKRRLVLSALVFWTAVFLLFLTFFWGNCGSGMPTL